MTDTVLYLSRVECDACERAATFGHDGPRVALDRAPPPPDVSVCPYCGADYPDDIGAATIELHEAERVLPAEERDAGVDVARADGGVAAVDDTASNAGAFAGLAAANFVCAGGAVLAAALGVLPVPMLVGAIVMVSIGGISAIAAGGERA